MGGHAHAGCSRVAYGHATVMQVVAANHRRRRAPLSERCSSRQSKVAVGLLAKRLGRPCVQNATLLLDDGSTWGSLQLHLTQPYMLPSNSCTWHFDAASLSALGAGASCSGGGDQSAGGRGTTLLLVQLGSGASVVAGAALTTRRPVVACGVLMLVTVACLRRRRQSRARAEVQMDCLTNCFPPEANDPAKPPAAALKLTA